MKMYSVRFSWLRVDKPATENVPKDQAGDKVPHSWREEDAHAHVLLHFVVHENLYKALSLSKSVKGSEVKGGLFIDFIGHPAMLRER